TSESSIASGTRRIEALTGVGALDYLRNLRGQMSQLAQTLKTTPDQLAERVAKLQDNVKKLEKSKTETRTAKADPAKIMESSRPAGKLQFASYRETGMELGDLRTLSDSLRSRASKMVYFLGADSGEKIYYLLGTSPDLKSEMDSRPLAQILDGLLDGKSGGRPDLVQGGAQNQGQLAEKWDKIVETAVDYLKRNS
ncbi:MAG TPA: DHHA1 domain-containing protein, partial [bacterium]|nr:DHHA1 domain-containing protein [bacterium]